MSKVLISDALSSIKNLLSRVVVVFEEELVDGQEGGPVASVGVDQEGEGAKNMLVRLVVERRQQKHQN